MIESSGFAIAAGGRMYFQRWRPQDADGEPIILIHESLGSVAGWRGFPAALAQACHREVIAYDRLGYGRSDPCTRLPDCRFIHDEATRQFPALLSACAIDRFTVFGHSVGGEMAVCMAAAHPRRCMAVVSVSAQAFVEACTLAGIRAARERFREPDVFARLQRLHGDKAGWVLDAWTKTWLSTAFTDWNVDAQLGAMACPLLVIHGTEDAYASQEQPRRMVRLAGGPSCLRMFQGCGHVPWREQGEQVLHEVTRFLAHAVAGQGAAITH